MTKSFLSFAALLLIGYVANAQTFQNTNALSRKYSDDRFRELKDIDTLKTTRTHLDTIDLKLWSDKDFQTKASKNYLREINDLAFDATSYLVRDNLIDKDIKIKVQSSIEDIKREAGNLNIELQRLDQTSDALERKEISARIKILESTLEQRQNDLEALKKNNAFALKQNTKLTDQITRMNNLLQGVQENLKQKDQAIVNYVKLIHKLRLKLNEPSLQGIFLQYSNANAKYIEIKTELDSANWFEEKSFSREDAPIVRNAYKELNRKFAGITQAKAKQEADSTAFSEVLDRYRKMEMLLGKEFENDPAMIIKIFNPLDDELDKKYKAAAASFRALEEQINTYTNDYKKTIAVVNPILAKYNKTETKEQHYSVFGGFKKILEEEGAFIPEINVFANKKFGQETFGGYGQIRLFTGAGITGRNFNTKLNYFVPEASSFSISLDLGLGFSMNTSDGRPGKNAIKGMKDIGINTSFYLMGKHLNVTDSLSVKPNVALWKTGLEILPFQNFFSLRANINALFTTNRLTEMKKHYVNAQKQYWYTDLAFSALLNIKETKNFNLKFDLNLIFVNKEMRDFFGTEDKILPQVKLELVSTF